jgi:hypothetical protein
VASFFLATFLGCQLKTNPEKATRDFVVATEQFINEDIASDEPDEHGLNLGARAQSWSASDNATRRQRGATRLAGA